MSYDAALYIHVPFCSRKCDYCDFYSICDYSLAEGTVKQTVRQMHQDRVRYGIGTFSSVYMGGGTPGSLDPCLTASLLDQIREANGGSLPKEVTLECNPENINPGSLKIWTGAGINRISLGVQSFQDRFPPAGGAQQQPG